MPYPNQFSQPYQYQYPPQVPAPMDRLAQLQANQYQMPQNMQPPQTNQGLLWVQGESAARSYLVAPNSTVLLMDSDASRFYIKSADNAGMPSLRTFEYTEVLQSTHQNAPQSPQSEQIDLDSKYVTRGEYDALQGKYMEILERLNNFPTSDNAGRQTAATNKSKGKGGDSNE